MSINEKRYGFSLVEVVLALGIIAFALVSIMGLLSLGLQNSKASIDNTNLALMSQTVISLLRADGYTTVVANNQYKPSANPAVIPIPDYYFDSSGQLSRDPNSGLPLTLGSNATYGCKITSMSAANLTPLSTNLVYLQLKFTWPIGAATQQQKIVLTSVAKYD